MPGYALVAHDDDAAAVRSRKQRLAVFELTERQDLRRPQLIAVRNGADHSSVLHEAQARIPSDRHRAVGELATHAHARAQVVPAGIERAHLAGRIHVRQALSVAADPQAPSRVGCQAADARPLEQLDDVSVDHLVIGKVDCAQPVVVAGVEQAVPERGRVDDALLQAGVCIDVLQRRPRKAQEAQARRREPKVSLVVGNGILDGILERARLLAPEHPVTIHRADPAVRHNPHGAVVHDPDAVDVGHSLAGKRRRGRSRLVVDVEHHEAPIARAGDELAADVERDAREVGLLAF